MSSDDNDARGENGMRTRRVSVVTFTYDHESCLVTIEATGCHLGLAQMIVDEGRRQLETQRRQAAALELQAKVEEARRDAAIAAAVRGRG